MAESVPSPSAKAGLPPGALVHVGAQPQAEGRVTLISYGPDHCTECEVRTVDDIIAHCKAHLAGFKVPKAIVFGELPKTSTGKIQKYELRKVAGSAQAIDV